MKKLKILDIGWEKNKIIRWFYKLRNWIFITSHMKDMYSYEKLLTKVLIKRKPKKILEWGTGKSTKLMRKLLPQAEIHSIEDDWRWYLRWKIGVRGVNLHYIPLNKNYTNPTFHNKYFDFIFVDGEKE